MMMLIEHNIVSIWNSVYKAKEQADILLESYFVPLMKEAAKTADKLEMERLLCCVPPGSIAASIMHDIDRRFDREHE